MWRGGPRVLLGEALRGGESQAVGETVGEAALGMRALNEGLFLHRSFLEGNYGPILRPVMRLLFSRVKPVGEQLERIRQLSQSGTVVYVLRSRSNLESLLCHYQCRLNGLPVPAVAWDGRFSLFQSVGLCWKRLRGRLKRGFRAAQYPSVKELVLKGVPLVLYLEDVSGFERRFIERRKDPFVEILEAQREMDKPVFLIPQMVIWDRARERTRPSLDEMLLGPRANPSDLRVLFNFLRFYRKDSHIFHAEPLDVRVFAGGESEEETLARSIRGELAERLRRERRLVTGPVVRSRQELLGRVLMDPRVEQAIQRRARKRGRSLESARKEAYGLLKEIAADYDPVFLRFWDWVIGWAVKRLFDGLEVEQEGLARVREAARRANLVLVPCHRSHMDYLIMGYIFYHNYLYPPLTAAGLNLAFWPMGFLFRKSGAFFIRRDFRGSVLYPVVFSRYLHTILSEGYPIEFFIEGGRSRSGKMVLPKPGFLSMLLEGHRSGACEDIAFVPVAISYDRVMEEGAYLREVEGGEKRKESLWEVLRSREVIKRRWGRIWVTFDEPVFLRDFIARTLDNPDAKVKYTRQNLPDFLGYEIVHRINRVMTVVPSTLVASVCLSAGLRGFSYEQAVRVAGLLHGILVEEGARLAEGLERAEAVEKVLRDTLEFFHREGMLRKVRVEGAEGEEEWYFQMDERNRRQLDYYKNSILHHFLPYSFVAAAVLSSARPVVEEERVVEEVAFLRDFFRQEFVFLPEEDLAARTRSILGKMVEKGLLWRAAGGYTSPLGRRRDLVVLARLIQGYFESYYVVGSSLRYLHRRRLSHRVFLWRVRLRGQRLCQEGKVRAGEALSQVNYLNGIEYLVHQKILVRHVEGKVLEGTYYTLSRERRPIHWGRLKRYMKVYGVD